MCCVVCKLVSICRRNGFVGFIDVLDVMTYAIFKFPKPPSLDMEMEEMKRQNKEFTDQQIGTLVDIAGRNELCSFNRKITKQVSPPIISNNINSLLVAQPTTLFSYVILFYFIAKILLNLSQSRRRWCWSWPCWASTTFIGFQYSMWTMTNRSLGW